MIRKAGRQERSIVGRSFVRSPALESGSWQQVEQKTGGKEARAGQRRATALQDRSVSAKGVATIRNAKTASMGRMRYAAVEPVERGAGARRPLKLLPRRGRVSKAIMGQSLQRTGVTAEWRVREQRKSNEQTSPVQVISEEEEKKLAELETRMPRVAGKIDPWLLMIVLALLCIGIVMVYSASSFIAARYEGNASY